jgi:LysM repeat protein
MSGLAGAQLGPSGVDDDDDGGRNLAYLIFGGLAVLFLAIVVVAITSLGGTDKASSADAARQAQLRKLPVYWTVRHGDSYGLIAEKTGLTVDELETFNPYTDPSAIVPGQRLKLRLKVPPPKPKPLGPKYFKLRSGDSFGSVAAKTGKNINRLQKLNPKMKAKELQPGDRIRLR